MKLYSLSDKLRSNQQLKHQKLDPLKINQYIPKTDDFWGRRQTSKFSGVHTKCMTGVSKSSQQLRKFICKEYMLKIASICLLGATFPVAASGFALKGQSVTNLGNAYAGTAAQADDASTAFYNAAGLTNLTTDQVTMALIGTKANIKLDPSVANNNSGTALNLASTKAKSKALLPGLHIAKRMHDAFVFGLSVASPFGFKTNYAADSTARVMARRSELRTSEISPSLAYMINERWSAAIGLDALKGKISLDTDIVSNLANSTGAVSDVANGWGYGYHFGLLFKPTDTTRMGVQYRSRIRINANGNSLSTVPNSPAPTRTVNSTLKLPDSIAYSVYHQYDDRWSMLGDLEFTHWSLFKELRLDFSNNIAASITPEHYQNTLRVALGTNYQSSDTVTWKAGMAYEQSPTRDENRTASIPDSDRAWLSLGGKYVASKQVALSFGYARLFFKNAAIDERAPLNQAGALADGRSLKGTYKTHADIVGVQLTWNFV